MEAEIIAICNKKGGVGKTTTAHALGAGFSLKGFKTLLIDLDSQCNLSQAAGADLNGSGAGELLKGETAAGDTIQAISDNLDIIPGSASLAKADIEINDTGKEYILKEILERLLPDYDYIVIDCPPSLGVLTVNALTAAGHLIIPAQADYFSFNALEDLQAVLNVIRKYTNPTIHTEGILFTRHNPRTVLSRDLEKVTADTAQGFGTNILKAKIREGIAIKEAQALHEDIFSYAPKSKAAEDYRLFVDEVLQGLKK